MPKSIARNLTFPEKVTKFNLKKMEQLVSNGTDIYPGRHLVSFKTSMNVVCFSLFRVVWCSTICYESAGAKYLKKKGGNTFRLDIIPDKSDLALDYGWRSAFAICFVCVHVSTCRVCVDRLVVHFVTSHRFLFATTLLIHQSHVWHRRHSRTAYSRRRLYAF